MKHQYWERQEKRRVLPDRREPALKNLREVREAARKNQVDVAEAMKKDQSEISRIENREDWLVSTLRDYIEALGGDLEVVAVIAGKRLKLRNV
jgi:hypothetical protein